MSVWTALKGAAWAFRVGLTLKASPGELLARHIFERGLDAPGTFSEMDEPFRQHPTVYRTLVAFSRQVARLPFEVFTDVERTQRVTDHPVLDLLRKPNPSLRGTQIFEQTTMHLEHWGDAIWWFGTVRPVNVGGLKLPTTIRMIPPKSVKAKLDKVGDVERWERTTGTSLGQPIPFEDTLHFKYSSPYSQALGDSWLGPASREFETDSKALSWNKSFFSRGADPGGVLETLPDFNLPDEELMRLKQQWITEQAGLFRAHGPAALPAGLKWVRTGIGQREMDFVRLREFSRENTLSTAGLPPALAGILQFANYANMGPQLRIFFELELMPRLEYMQSVLQCDFLERFETGLFGKFNTDVITALLEDMNTKADVAGKLWGLGVTLAEINNRLDMGLDLKDTPTANQSFLPFSVVPAEMAGQAISPPGQGGDREEEPVDSEEEPPPDSDAEEEEGLPVAARAGLRECSMKRLKGERARAYVWRTLIETTRGIRSRAESKYRAHVLKLQKEVLTKLAGPGPRSVRQQMNEGQIEAVLFDLQEADEELTMTFEPVWRSSVERGAETVAAQTGIAIDFDFLDPAVIQALTNRRVHIVGTNSRMREELRSLIAEATREGIPEVEIAERVRQYFNGQRSNARHIARTEVHSGFSSGRFESMRQTNIQQHEWLSSRDGRVRSDHIAEDLSPPVPVGSPFPITRLLYPLQPGGPAEQVVNCRCVTLPVVAA